MIFKGEFTLGQHWIQLPRPRFIDWLFGIKADLLLDVYWYDPTLQLRIVLRDRGYPLKVIEISRCEIENVQKEASLKRKGDIE